MGEFQLVKKKGGNGGDTSSALGLLPYPSSCFSLFLPLSPSLEPFLTSLEAERPRSVPKRESSNWALISRVFCPVASSIASATSSRADAADAATTALRRRRWEAGLLLRGSNAGAAAVLLVEGADPRGAAAAAASAGEARTLAARRCMAFFDRKQKRKGKEGNGSKKSASLLPFDRNSRAKRFDANLCFLPRTFSLVALPFVPFSLSLPVAFSFSDPFQTTMFALKSSAASRAAVVAPRRQVRTGRAGVESKSRSVFFFLRWLSLRRLFALCSLFFFPGPALTFS